MIRVFTGWDAREAIGWHVFAQSVIERTSVPVALTPLAYSEGAMQRDGTNAFTYARFMVPELCGFSGWAIFVDGADMVAVGDLAELWALRDEKYAVQVVKHDYQTKHPRKYVGTEMESVNSDYPGKNRSSVILWNCSHIAHFNHRKQLRSESGEYLHRFAWLKEGEIGELPVEWNWLADEYGANTKAKLLHWTAGIPAIYSYRNSPHAQFWHLYSAKAQQAPEQKMAVAA